MTGRTTSPIGGGLSCGRRGPRRYVMRCVPHTSQHGHLVRQRHAGRAAVLGRHGRRLHRRLWRASPADLPQSSTAATQKGRPVISAAASCSRQAAGVELTALTPGMSPTNQPCTCLKRQTARGCPPGQPGADGVSWTSTGRLAGVSMADGRSPQETRAWLSGRRLARGRDLPARLNFGSDLVHFSDAADQSAISAGIRPV